MSAVKANNNQDTYKAAAVTLIVFGILYLADKLVHFASVGLSWVMNKVFVSGMRIGDLISRIESEFSSLPCPHGPSQTPDFEYPRDRSTVRIF